MPGGGKDRIADQELLTIYEISKVLTSSLDFRECARAVLNLLRNQLLDETGLKPTWSPESFRDLDADLRQSMERIRRNPFLVDTSQVRGFVFDVHTGELREVV